MVFRSAVLGSPVGLKGFIKIRSFSGEYGHLAVLKTMRLELPSGGSKELSVEAFRAAGTGSAVKFAGFDTPEAVKKFSGAEVLLERSQAAPLGPGEYYIEDLKGLLVAGTDKKPLGRVHDVIDAGGASYLEVEIEGGAGKPGARRCLVPFRKEFVGAVEIEKGCLELLKPWVLDTQS